jgi:hypothetical protein
VFLFVLVAPALAAEITGNLVDQDCYTKDKATITHAECDVAGAKKGQPVVLVTDKAEVYVIAGDMTKNNNTRLVPFMSQKVTIVGSLGVDNKGQKLMFGSAMRRVPKPAA